MTYISQVLDALQKSYNTYADLLFQGVNVSNTVIELCKRFLGVPQESIFFSLLFNGISSLQNKCKFETLLMATHGTQL